MAGSSFVRAPAAPLPHEHQRWRPIPRGMTPGSMPPSGMVAPPRSRSSLAQVAASHGAPPPPPSCSHGAPSSVQSQPWWLPPPLPPCLCSPTLVPSMGEGGDWWGGVAVGADQRPMGATPSSSGEAVKETRSAAGGSCGLLARKEQGGERRDEDFFLRIQCAWGPQDCRDAYIVGKILNAWNANIVGRREYMGACTSIHASNQSAAVQLNHTSKSSEQETNHCACRSRWQPQMQPNTTPCMLSSRLP
jgi:hypothetical protein